MRIHEAVVGLVLGLVLLGASTSCQRPTGLNVPCRLVASDGDGGVRFVSEAELEARATFGSSRSDFVTFGAVECEDLVCVRDGRFEGRVDGGQADGGRADGGPFLVAEGYCSRPCTADSQCLALDPMLDGNPALRQRCRPLVLDTETLAAIRADPVLRRFIPTEVPTFCARGGGDAGL